jgi:hypothetical protein
MTASFRTPLKCVKVDVTVSKTTQLSMHTPAGKECRHYYEDFNRGRDVQECRLIQGNPRSMRWHPSDCARCPVPDILNANANPELRLELTVKPRLLGLGRQLEVKAWCRDEPIAVEDAYTGCVEDRPGLDIFRQALEDDD